MPLNPRDIVDVKDEPIIDPNSKSTLRIDPTTQQVTEPQRRAVTYRDGTVEYFEWDKRGDPPPGPVPWGRQLPQTGVNQPIQNDWAQAQKTEETTAKGQVFETPGGLVRVPPGGKPELIYPTTPNPPREPVSSANGEFWQMGPDGYMHMVGSSPSALEDRRIKAQQDQATETRLAQQAAETQRQNAFQNQLAAIKAAEAANEIDAKRAQELRDYLYKTQVEYPQKLREQEDVLKGNALTYGQNAGTQAVSDVTSMLPYRYSPGFMERRQQGIEAIGRGDYRPQTIARGYTGPDLTGTRQQAAGQAQGQYLNTFGFDPMPVANQIAYRPPVAPQAGAAAPMVPSGDDEEFLKRIARELAGTGGNP